MVEFYVSDVNDFNQVKSEITLWNRYLDDSNIEQKSPIEIINKCNSDLFPNAFKLNQILIILPVTSVEVERSFSTFNRVKNYLGYSTSESRLNGLAALNIHYNICVTYKEIIITLENFV